MSAANAIATIDGGRERMRAGPWRGDPSTAYLNPAPGFPLPSTDFVRSCLKTLARQGYSRVVTGALSATEQGSFRAAGFSAAEHLHLLRHNLRELPGSEPLPAGMTSRRAAKQDRGAALALDARAFAAFWRLDESGLDEALHATARTRFRVLTDGAGDTIAYAITGRSGRRGYLQRLAVEPTLRRQRLGRLLALDALRWLRRWGVRQAMVNTQLDNGAALSLYEGLGFRRQPTGLSVLAIDLLGA